MMVQKVERPFNLLKSLCSEEHRPIPRRIELGNELHNAITRPLESFHKIAKTYKFLKSSFHGQMSRNRFEDLVFKGYQQEVLRVLLDRPDAGFTVNEVAEETSASYNSVKSFLEELGEYGVVRFERKGSYRLVTYDPDNRYHDLLTDILTVDDTARREVAEEYAEELYRGNEEEIESIALFGSTARGTASKDSDIDVLVLVGGDEGKVEKRARDLASGSKEFSGTVPVVETIREFRNNLVHGKRFEESVVRDAITLEGDDVTYAEVIEKYENNRRKDRVNEPF